MILVCATPAWSRPLPALPPELEPVTDTEDASAWADEVAPDRKGNFGAVGIIAAAVLIMVVVYLGATMLMR